MFLDDLEYYREPEAGAEGLRAEVRLEDLVHDLLGDAGARVGDPYLHRVSRAQGLDPQAPSLGHGGYGVLDEVEQRLLDEAGVDAQHRDRGGKVAFNLHACLLQLGAHEIEQLRDDLIDVAVLQPGIHRLHGEEEIHDDPVEPVDFLVYHGKVLADILGHDPALAVDLLLNELEMDPDGAQGILDLVGHPRGQVGERCQALSSSKPRLLGALLRHVFDMDQIALDAAPSHQGQDADGQYSRGTAVQDELAVRHLLLVCQLLLKESGDLAVRQRLPEELL